MYINNDLFTHTFLTYFWISSCSSQLIGRGRYGTVYHGSIDGRSVAVKVFISSNRQQFTNERLIYRNLLDHENIAHFLESEERVGTEGRTEFLLLLEFYPHVSIARTLRNPNQVPKAKTPV